MTPARCPRHPDRVPIRAASRAIVFAASAVLVIGCATESRVVYDGWGKFKEMGDPKANQTAVRSGEQSYTIMLERFTGKDRLAKAEALNKLLRSKGLPDLDVQENAGIVTVSVGRFTDPGSAPAQAMLRRVRLIEVDGNRLYSSANFIAGEGGKRIYDPLDLRQYSGRHTLQIAFYDQNYQGDPKAAAEEAARTLREEGVEAYFYHGPRRSLVCVGLFTDLDFEDVDDPTGGNFQVQRYGPRIRELQDRFPYNLGNGVTLIEKNAETGKVIGEQPSTVVRVM